MVPDPLSNLRLPQATMIIGEEHILTQRLAGILAENPIGLVWKVERIYRLFKCLNTPDGIELIRSHNTLWSTIIRKASQLTEQLDVKINLLGDEITPVLLQVSQEMREQIKQVTTQL